MFVNFKRVTLKIKVSDYLNPMENSVFQFYAPDYQSVKPSFAKDVLLE